MELELALELELDRQLALELEVELDPAGSTGPADEDAACAAAWVLAERAVRELDPVAVALVACFFSTLARFVASR